MAFHALPVHRTVSRFVLSAIALAALLVLAVISSAHTAIAAQRVIANPQQTWAQQKVFDAGGGYQDQFGIEVAISGTTALIGGPQIAVNGNSAQGTVYVYKRAVNGSWSEAQRLVASDGAAYHGFGRAVAMSGRTAVIGSTNARIGSNPSQGAAYVFTQGDDGMWTQTQKLVSSNGAPVEWFGNAIAMSDDTIVIAAYGGRYNDQAMRGAVYVFNKVGGIWTQMQELAADDGVSGDALGSAVALSGSNIFASAPGAGIGDKHNQGAVYVFSKVDGTWSQTQKLVTTDGAENDQLGTSIAVDGNTAFIGAVWHHAGHGAAYVFTQSGGNWSQTQMFSVNDAAANTISGIGVPPTDFFGNSIALHGGTALIGGHNVDINGNSGQGAVYQFSEIGGTWSSTHTFTANDGVALDFFGCAVDFDGANILAGAFGYTPDWDHYQQGAAYFLTASGIPASERAVLVDLYNSTNGAGWWDTVGWLGEPGTECNWSGITCNESGTSVVGISLLFANLTGSLPASLNRLTNLTNLQFNDNRNLSGSIPSLTGLTRLQNIDLSRNGLTGSLPSLAGLTSLEVASFNSNQLSGTIPAFAGLTRLQWFTVSDNQLSGSIPSLEGLGALTGFYVNYNKLTGLPPVLPVPTSLGKYSVGLCPNHLDQVESALWDNLTGATPWYWECTVRPDDVIFSSGFDAP